MMRVVFAVAAWFVCAPAQAQVAQCPTPAVGGSAPIASTPNCASQAFVTKHFPSSSTAGHLAAYADSSGQLLSDGGAIPTGTVQEVDTAGLATGGPITGTGTVTVTAASKTDEQTGTSATVATTPSQQQQHDSAAKGWIYTTQSGGTYTTQASYNMSFAKSGTGTGTLSFTTPFSSAHYALICTTGGNNVIMNYVVLNAGSATINIQIATTGANVDSSFACSAFGRQ